MDALQLARTDRTQRGLSQFSRKYGVRQSHRFDSTIRSLAQRHVYPAVGSHPANCQHGTGHAKKARLQVGTVETTRRRVLNDLFRLKGEGGYRLCRITLRISARRIGCRDRAENRDL